MNKSNESHPTPPEQQPSSHRHMGSRIAGGLVLGLVCGLLFGEYCAPLGFIGQAYVGLLQMTVLPFLMLSLIAKTGRLDVSQARKLGVATLVVLLILWLFGVVLIVLVTGVLPPVEGASFYTSLPDEVEPQDLEVLSRIIPANIFRALSQEFVPAVVVFCLFFGGALIMVPHKEPLLDFLELSATAVGRINMFLVRLAPVGLFALTAAATGTVRLEEMARLQAYLLTFALACLVAVFVILPLLVSSVTDIRYRDVLNAAREPLLMVIATGKLFVVLPEISEKCEELLREKDESHSEIGESTARVVVPLAYPFPHLGKILGFIFISFAAWYVGRGLTFGQTWLMAGTGVLSSFASPLVAMPSLLDQHQLPQDLMALFILPGFLTTRLADMVGVMHLMALALIVSRILEGRVRIRWHRVALAALVLFVTLGTAGISGRWYLTTTKLQYDLDKRLLALEVPFPHNQVTVYHTRAEVPNRPLAARSTLERIKQDRVMRVGYPPDHFPNSFFNLQGRLVGRDVELMHRLAAQLQVQLAFIPYTAETVGEQLELGEIDVAVGGLIILPERLLRAAFTQPYETATMAVVVPDHRRYEFDTWSDRDTRAGTHLGALHEDMVIAARNLLPHVEVVPVDSPRSFFTGARHDLSGLVMAAQEGAAWTVLYPEYTVVVPRPLVRKPVGMAIRTGDADWLHFLDRWLDYERLDGALDRLRIYWVEGGGTQQRPPRWSVTRDVLQWFP